MNFVSQTPLINCTRLGDLFILPFMVRRPVDFYAHRKFATHFVFILFLLNMLIQFDGDGFADLSFTICRRFNFVNLKLRLFCCVNLRKL